MPFRGVAWRVLRGLGLEEALPVLVIVEALGSLFRLVEAGLLAMAFVQRGLWMTLGC